MQYKTICQNAGLVSTFLQLPQTITHYKTIIHSIVSIYNKYNTELYNELLFSHTNQFYDLLPSQHEYNIDIIISSSDMEADKCCYTMIICKTTFPLDVTCGTFYCRREDHFRYEHTSGH